MFKKITRKYLEKFLSKYASEKKVLDIGSGEAAHDLFFPNRVTVDLNRKFQPDIVADAHNLPIGDEAYEIILCTEVLEHLKRPLVAIKEMHRVLKRGGLLILTTRFAFPLHDSPDDYWRFTNYGLRELFKDWEIIELVPEATNFSNLAVILQRMAYQSRFRLNKIIKLIVFLLAWLFSGLNFVILQQYGDIRKTVKEENIVASGYYLVAKKV